MASYFRQSILVLGLLILGLLTACTSQSTPAGGVTHSTQGGAPARADVLSVLTSHYTNTDYATRKYTLTLDSMTVAAPRLGDHWADGVPVNTTTTVYPIKATLTRIVAYSTDNTTRHETIDGQYVFFKDEFGAWTFAIKQETIK